MYMYEHIMHKISIVFLQTNIALVYSESIEKLKGILVAMQNASQKREKLEKQLREQLQIEIGQLKGGSGGGGGRTNSKLVKEKSSTSVSDLQQQVLLLEAEVAKVCLLFRILPYSWKFSWVLNFADFADQPQTAKFLPRNFCQK